MATISGGPGQPIPLPLGVLVGRNVRRVRLLRGLSISDLARSADVSRGTLTELEGGRANPTVETVGALARVLGVPVVELLADITGSETSVVRSGEGAVVVRDTARFRLLHRIEAHQVLIETWDARLRRGRHEAAPLPLGTMVHAYVVSGSATLGPIDAPVDVEAGDAVLYRADVPALFACRRATTVVLVVAYPPSSAPEALSNAVAGH